MTRLSGGCQCGAIRFSVAAADLSTIGVCHCRMCQKAMGNLFATHATTAPDKVTWTRGTRTLYRSSSAVQRGFCAACGTPLSYEPDADWMCLTVGAFDHPADILPTIQFGAESLIPYAHHLIDLPLTRTDRPDSDAPFTASLTSFQHPDEDTDVWPSQEPRP